jgi:DNA invertase Pin-like site-specific DNA recombinase
VTGDVDLSTDQGRLVARIMGAVARAEVERKGKRQKSANEQRARNGNHRHVDDPLPGATGLLDAAGPVSNA